MQIHQFLSVVLALSLLSGCSTVSGSKRETYYQNAMRDALRADWKQKENKVKPVNPEKVTESACISSKYYEEFLIENYPLTATENFKATAVFCPNEKEYWVRLADVGCSGPATIAYGPFPFEMPKELAGYKNERSVKNQTSGEAWWVPFFSKCSSCRG